MIVVLLNQKGGVGKTTLALRLASHWARREKHVTLIDADPQGSAFDWSEQRARDRFGRLFGVSGLARDTVPREAPEHARDVVHVVIDSPPRIAALLCSALLAAEIVLMPAQPSPYASASAEMLAPIAEARLSRHEISPHFVHNRCTTHTVTSRNIAEALADHDPPALIDRIIQRAVESEKGELAARGIATLTSEVARLRCGRIAP